MRIKTTGAQSDKEHVQKFLKWLKPYTGRNPYLLACAMEEKIIAELCAIFYTMTRQYIENTIPRQADPHVLDHIHKILEYFHFAQENAWLNATIPLKPML